MSSAGTNQTNEILTDKLKKTTALVYYGRNFVSSGIVFKIIDKVYFITAGHSIYGKEFNETKEVNKLEVKVAGVYLPVDTILGNVDFAKKHDLVVLKIDDKDASLDILDFKFYSIPKNPSHRLIFRGSYDPEKGISNNRDNLFDELEKDTTKYRIETKKEKLVNSFYDHGSDWLGGISGSGIFYQDKNEVCCCGIIVEIINKGDEGKIMCASFEPAVALLPELNLIKSETLDFDSNLSKFSINKIIEDNTAEVISDWEIEPGNDPRVKHINNKLPLIYPESQLVIEKTRLIRNFCIGINFIELELTNNETLKALYNEVYNAYDLQEKTIYADTRKEARVALNNIKDKYQSYLHSMLEEKGFNQATVILLKEYAISEWISNCSINILNDE
jgi:hypothetical protein